MSTFEISTCFSRASSTLDAQVLANAVQEALPVTDYSRMNGGELFCLTTDEVFFGTRRAHTNVRVTLRNSTLEQAKAVQAALSKASGIRWNSPSQDYDEVQAELAGQKSYGMFSAAGAQAVAAVVSSLSEQLEDGTLSPLKLSEALDEQKKLLADQGHGEVYDTAVRESIWDELDRKLESLGIRLLEV